MPCISITSIKFSMVGRASMENVSTISRSFHINISSLTIFLIWFVQSSYSSLPFLSDRVMLSSLLCKALQLWPGSWTGHQMFWEKSLQLPPVQQCILLILNKIFDWEAQSYNASQSPLHDEIPGSRYSSNDHGYFWHSHHLLDMVCPVFIFFAYFPAWLRASK